LPLCPIRRIQECSSNDEKWLTYFAVTILPS
jgi:hypothetical protein